MAKKRFTYDDAYDEDEELLLDRKAKRKRERELERQRQEAEQAPQHPADETMVRVVAACQANQWREAAVICLTAMERFRQEGQPEMAESISAAFEKLDRSLRRQMIAAFVRESETLLSHKE